MKEVLAVMALALAGLVSCQGGDTGTALPEALKPPKVLDAGKPVLLPDEADIAGECDKIMGALAQTDIKQAFAYMEKIFPLPAEDFTKLKDDTTKMLESVSPRFGKIIGYERVSVVKKSESVLVSTYILKMESIAFRWRFIFYKPKDKWFINSMRWDDKLGEDW
ncbi:MAG: hypothetical protein HZA49_08170 [Planctomycetes bacterium]|nr:hypothetical protein [Planctomycetota bacterium]